METDDAKKLILTDKFEVDIIELRKIEGKEKEKDQLLDWLMFLENPESERVTQKMKENENLKEAVEKLNKINEDEKMQRIIELREKAIRDEHAIYTKGIEDEKKRLESEVARGEKMLSNPGFVSKAPEKKINEEKEKLANYKELLASVIQKIDKMK